MNPSNMVTAIQEFCRCTDQPAPESSGQFVRCILESLALRYRQIIEDINQLQGKRIEKLHVVGGGSQNTLLNQFTADACGLPVYAGPAEATTLGNVLMQAIATGQLDSVEQGRAMIAKSFPVRDFFPQESEAWDEAYHRFQKMMKKQDTQH